MFSEKDEMKRRLNAWKHTPLPSNELMINKKSFQWNKKAISSVKASNFEPLQNFFLQKGLISKRFQQNINESESCRKISALRT
jgi:hypothetical protein